MLLSKYVDTEDLTKSFQWDIRETAQQQDIQEFLLQLFDAVSETF